MKKLLCVCAVTIFCALISCSEGENKIHWNGYKITSNNIIYKPGNKSDSIMYFNYIIGDKIPSYESIAYKIPGPEQIEISQDPLLYLLSIGHEGDTLSIEKIHAEEEVKESDDFRFAYPITIEEVVSKTTFAERQIKKILGRLPDSILTTREREEAMAIASLGIKGNTACTYLGKEIYMCTIHQGTGEIYEESAVVTIYYTAMLKNGLRVIDNNYNSNNPFIIMKGSDEVIPGWRHALKYVYKGSRVLLFIPAEEAYGDNTYGDVPPGSDLVFLMDLY